MTDKDGGALLTREDLQDGLLSPLPDADALAEAAMCLAAHGIEIKLPWNCSLDVLETEHYVGLVEACRAYHAARLSAPTGEK